MNTRNDGLFVGKYKILRELGSGGYARVFLAKESTLDRFVAIKILDSYKLNIDKDIGSSKAAIRFEREARAMSKMKSKNTVTMYDFGVTPKGVPYIVLEYIAGTPLKDIIESEGKQSSRRIVAMLKDILSSLEEAHAAGLIHRDIKPGNIMMTKDKSGRDTFVLLDFGIVQNVDGSSQIELTGENKMVGTPRYMSPEQIKFGGALQPSSDLYSLGLVAHEMATGKPAIEGETRIAVLANQISAESVRLEGSDLSPHELVALIDSMTEKNLAERSSDSSALLETLSRIGPMESDHDRGDLVGLDSPRVVVGRPPEKSGASLDDDVAREPVDLGLVYRLLSGTLLVGGATTWIALTSLYMDLSDVIRPYWIYDEIGPVTLAYGAFCFIPFIWYWGEREPEALHLSVVALWGVVTCAIALSSLYALWLSCSSAIGGHTTNSAILLSISLGYGVAFVSLARPIWRCLVSLEAADLD